MPRTPGFTLSVLALGAALAIAPSALAQAVQPLSPTPLGSDTITITAMAPVPDVGTGAPLYSAGEMIRMHEAAKNELSRAMTTVMRCKIRSRRLPGQAPEQSDLAIFQSEPTDTSVASRGRTSMFSLVEDELYEHRAFSAAVGKAKLATEKAEKARVDVVRGLVDQAAVNDAELARQKAVNNMELARVRLFERSARVADFQYAAYNGQPVDDANLEARALRRERAGVDVALAPDALPQLKLSLNQAALADTKAGELAVVTGEIANTGRTAVDAPRIAVAALDAKGFELTRVISASKGRIAPGGRQSFAYGLASPPEATAALKVYFVSDLAPAPRMPMAMFDSCLGN